MYCGKEFMDKRSIREVYTEIIGYHCLHSRGEYARELLLNSEELYQPRTLPTLSQRETYPRIRKTALQAVRIILMRLYVNARSDRAI